MLRGWIKYLPFVVVVWISKTYGERLNMSVVKGKDLEHKVITNPYDGVYIQVFSSKAEYK